MCSVWIECWGIAGENDEGAARMKDLIKIVTVNLTLWKWQCTHPDYNIVHAHQRHSETMHNAMRITELSPPSIQ